MSKPHLARTRVVGGVLHWHYVRTLRAWVSDSKPRYEIHARIVTVKGRQQLGWRLKPGRQLFYDYAEAMLAAEGITPLDWRTATSRKRSRRR